MRRRCERLRIRCMSTPLVVVLGAAICLALVGARQANAQSDGEAQPRLLTAVGESEVRARPDLGEVRLGVETEAPTAAEAREQNAVRAGGITDGLKALGIPESAIRTSLFQIYPVRRFEDGPGRGEPPIVAYRVVNIVSVRTADLDLVPRIIDESVEAGANRVENVSFTLREEDAAKRTALRQAVADARESAAAMAGELGVALVEPHSIRQGAVGIVRPPAFFRGAMAEAAAPTPVFPGEVTVRASVTLSYLIQ